MPRFVPKIVTPQESFMKSTFRTLAVVILAMNYGCTDGWDCQYNSDFSCQVAFAQVDTTKNISEISFGSCLDPNDDFNMLPQVAATQPDLFIFLGDNVYIDSERCEDFFSEYGKLACKSGFADLVGNSPTLAVWDDHDYGSNDAGVEYGTKRESKDVFLRFWHEPGNSNRRKHEGIYHSLMLGDTAHRLQVILLDMRTFRSPLAENDEGYLANYDPSKTFLGEQQWAWLEAELKKPAKVRIIASSTQFAIEHNGWECWANFPLEQIKMAETIARAGANGVVFISGDVHYAELSRQQWPGCYPIYDCTSSGLTRLEGAATPNQFRIGEAVLDHNFGKITIDWEAQPITLTYTIATPQNQQAYTHTIGLNEISF